MKSHSGQIVSGQLLIFGHGQDDDVSVMAWRSFKLPSKIAGSNNGETQALAFADESLWLVRLDWSEMYGASMRLCQPSSLQSELRSIGARLSQLQTAIDGQESRRALDKMSKLRRSRLDTSFFTRRSGSSQLASDKNLVADSMSWNRATLQTNTEHGSFVRDVPFAHITFPGTMPG